MPKKRNFFKFKRPYVLVPMCLDYLHHGHVNILKKSKKYGNIIIGLITDKGIQSYKKNKTINNFFLRKKIALMLKDVKHVIPIKSPLNYLSTLRKYNFDYIVHGDDWKRGAQSLSRKKIIKEMKKLKGKVIEVPYTKKISSTKIKSYIKNDRSNKKSF